VTADAETERTAPISCAPCRGTGRVVSNLGGEPSTVSCPWCEGTGTFIAEHDAQAARRAQAGSD
jgi:DnaJ-class molecular chaperone